MRVAVRMLGNFEVAVDGEVVSAAAWRRTSAAALVKLLALQQPRARLLRDQVVDALWPDLTLEEAAPRLHTAAHYARSAIGLRDAVRLAAGTVEIFPDAHMTVDVAEFETAAARAVDLGDAGAAAKAAALYRGDLLPEDVYESWTADARSRLRVRYLEMLAMAGEVERLVAEEPLDEEAHLALVRHHLQARRRRSALEALDRMSEILERELGVTPGTAVADLRQQALALPIEVAAATGDTSATAAGPGLPAPRSRLIARDSDLTAITSLLAAHRVVTVTGPGGVGKTSVALAVAREIESGGEDDVVFAELAPVRSATGIVRAVAEAAGVQGDGATKAPSLAAALAHRSVVLVLDNCEHLMEATAELVDAVLDAGPRSRILLTSREPLRVDGEAEHRLGSLGAGSVELFVERASAAAGTGVVDADDPRVAELCAHLDGLPLAIELAAGQLRHLALPVLLERLDDRLELLVGGRPKAGERHSALAATIEWSYRLLSPGSRQAFERLAVFPSTFDLESAGAVIDEQDPAALAALMGDLVAKSLVVHHPDQSRYRLLETIRLFAGRRLDDAVGTPGAKERLRQHLLSRARAAPRVQVWLSTTLAARSRDDLDSVRLAFEASVTDRDYTAAVDLALGLSTLWRNAASYAEGGRWVELLRGSDLEPRDRHWVSVLSLDIAVGSGNAKSMRGAARDVLHQASSGAEEGAVVIATVYDAMSSPDPAHAVARLDEATRRARAAGEDGLERFARGYQVVARRMTGRTEGLRDDARALLEETAGAEPDYASYLCKWAASMVAMVERDGVWLSELIANQRADLARIGLPENWLTLYWEALALVARGEPSLAQLRRTRTRAAAEGRSVDADCVLVLGYAAACADEWERAAELVGATADAMSGDTAGYLHHLMLAEQLVRPHLDEAVYRDAAARGRRLVLSEVLRAHGLADDATHGEPEGGPPAPFEPGSTTS